MSISPSTSSSPPVVFPAPGWLFFTESLPLGETPVGAIEDTVLLSLESHSPLPVEQLAYGWRIDSTKKTLVYYAGARDRLRHLSNGIYEGAGHVIPDFMLAPKGKPGEWRWIATAWAITAVRSGDTDIPQEVRSWSLSQGEPYNLAERAEAERVIREPSLTGNHVPGILLWDGATAVRGGKILATWRPKNGKSQTVTIMEDVAWHADVRERSWLTLTKKTRSRTQFFNRLTIASLFALLLVAGAGAALFFHKEELKKESERLTGRESAVEAINGKAELVARLDQLEAGQVSFFDALATMNHFRPSEILFASASIDGNRQVQINGTAATISQINSYVEALRNSGFFKQVDLPRVNTSGGRTSFEIKAGVGTLAVSRGSVEEEANEHATEVMPAGPVMTPATPVAGTVDVAKAQQEAIFADARNLAAAHGMTVLNLSLHNDTLVIVVPEKDGSAGDGQTLPKYIEAVRAAVTPKGVSSVGARVIPGDVPIPPPETPPPVQPATQPVAEQPAASAATPNP